MCSAPNGRKNRPRSAANIFQIGKPPQRDPERRESTESARRAQRAVDDCRMVSLPRAYRVIGRLLVGEIEPTTTELKRFCYPTPSPGFRDADHVNARWY